MPTGTFENSLADGPALTGRRGFALLITITLLAFLVLLLVSLAALTRVETQVAGNSQQFAQARQNALMALNIALGQLQKAAGPDQRVTATADLAGGSGGVRLQIAPTTNSASTAPDANTGNKKYWDSTNTDNGLGKVVAGTRYWTGVWGNSDPATPTAGNGNIYEKTPRPVLLNWLVSGNEGTTFTSSTATATFGQITTPGTSISYTPTGTATAATAVVKPSSGTFGIMATATTALTFGGVATKPVVLLVGAKAAGTEDRTLESKELAADRYVVAPLVNIQVPANIIPGLGTGTTATTIGRYAYWVGDEGVKARINLADRYATSTAPATDPLARARLLTAPRSGAEIVADTPVSGTFTDFANTSYATWSTTDASAQKAMSLSQMGFLDATNLTSLVMGRHFNDFTTVSVGVEADAYNGGLRRDLTCYFEQGTLPTWTDSYGASGAGYGIIPGAYSPIDASLSISATIKDTLEPKWDVLSSFYKLPVTSSTTLTGSASDTVNIQAATATQMGITPVVVQMRLMIGIHADSDNKKFRVLANPLVVLANPYNVALAAPNGLNFALKQDTRVPYDGALKIMGENFLIFGGGGVFDGTVFHIPPFTLAPGKAQVFSYTGTSANAASFSTASPVPLSAGFNAATLSNVYREYTWSNAPTPANPDMGFRVDELNANSSFLVEFTLPGSTQIVQQIGCINPDRGTTAQHTGTMYPVVHTPSNANDDRGMFVYTLEYNSPGSPSPASPLSSSPEPGIANTLLRSFADFNPRAGYFRLIKGSFSSPPYTQFYVGPASIPLPGSPGLPLIDFLSGLSDPSSSPDQYWGRDWAMPTTGTPVKQCILFDIPRRTKTGGAVISTDLPIFSLGNFQHVNLTVEDLPATANTAVEFGSSSAPPPNTGHQPAYAFGNSYASIFLPREKTVDSPAVVTTFPRSGDYWLWASGSITTYSPSNPKYFDISYLLNASVWDGYFFSSIPQSASASGADAFAPINPRLTQRSDTTVTAAFARDGQKAAAYTLIDGAFNINSTSVGAWVAVLGGMKNLPYIPGLGTNGSNSSTVFPRTIRQTAQAASPPTGTGADSYSGYRQLTDANVQALAAAIVKQVRMRGPFVSLAHFVNRVLVSAASDGTNGLGQAGALQNAIDTAGLNLPFSAVTTAADQATIPTADDTNAFGGDANSRGTNSLFVDGASAASPTPLQRSTGIPGWLTQADVLQAIGPVISARSDTFVIRAYGETNNPVLNPTTPAAGARAWCEAVVQRTPDYVDQTDANLTGSGNATAPAATNAINQTYGRRFKIVSFRWLSPNDI